MRVRPLHFPGAFYHVVLRGNRKQEIFRDERDFRHLDRLVGVALDRYNSEVHAYCWMPNHLHLLMRVNEVPVHRSIHYFAMMYAKYFNFRYGYVGHLFQGRYRSRWVDSDGYLLQLLRYIHLNPVKANLVAKAEDYSWGSMRSYLNLANTQWLNQSVALRYFAQDRKAFYRFVSADDDSFDPWAKSDTGMTRLELASRPATLTSSKAWCDLDEIVAAACVLFRLSKSDLMGSDARRELTLARCWIVWQATRGNVATLSATARYLCRSPAALSKSMRVNAKRLAKVKG
jgi:REP-associated tyrosine transposase